MPSTQADARPSPQSVKAMPTPGPWRAINGTKVYHDFTVCGQPCSRLIANCETHSDYTDINQQEANARLIAASPALLAALKDSNAALENMLRIERLNPDDNETIVAARSAIQSATL